MIPPWAVKGAKVVCVDDFWPGRDGRIEAPIKGQVCTIETIDPTDAQILLVEFPQVFDGQRCWWSLRRFRPLVTRSQEHDIAEHFAGHLHQRVPEKA